MAAKYAVAAGGNWTADATWSTTSGGAADTTKPTAADDVFLDAASGGVTIDAASVCRSLNCTGYTGTLTHNAFTLSIGDATAGASNIALKFVAGMTYTLANAITSAISFVTTSATAQTIDFAGKTTGSVTFNATSNGSWQYIGAHNTGATAIVTLTKGTLDVNGQTCSWGFFTNNSGSTRTFTIGAGTNLTMTGGSGTWNTIAAGLTITQNSGADSNITFTGANASAQMGTSANYGNVNVIASGSGAFSWTPGCPVIKNFTRTGTAIKTDSVNFNNTTLVCTGTLTLTGNSSTNRLLANTSTAGTSATVTAATWVVTNTDFQDITGAGAGSRDFSAITGNSGDCGGNSGITFTTAATQTYTGGTDNWSTAAKWTSRVPLPQDDVSMSGVTSGTITADMPRLGKNIDWTGASGSPTFSISTNLSSYGSITLISDMSMSGGNTWTLASRASSTITSAGKTFPSSFQVTAPGGTYTMQDAFITSANWTITMGGWINDNLSFTCSLFQASGALTRSISFVNSTIGLTSTAAFQTYRLTLATNLTYDFTGSTISFTTATTNTRTFDSSAGLTYGTLTYTVAGSTGQLNITGANSFAAINFSDATNARTLAFTAATTTTIRNTNGFNVQGTSGKLMTVQSVTAATHTLSSTGRQSCDYLNLVNSIATGGGSWYAGANSTDGTGNTGWIFAAAPPQVAGSPARQSLRNLQNLMSL